MRPGLSSADVEGISDAIESVVRVGAAVVHESVSGSREEEKEEKEGVGDEAVAEAARHATGVLFTSPNLTLLSSDLLTFT